MLALFHRIAPQHTVDVFADGMALLGAITEGICYDLLFLDIIMPGKNGLEMARELAELAPDVSVIFLTDSDAYAVEAFSVRALHYIIKPMTESALLECLNRLEEKQAARRRVHITSSSGLQQMIYADEIQFAESSAHYFAIHLVDGTVIRVRMTQSEIKDTLGDTFLLISRGLIVNVEFIHQLGPNFCILRDGRRILLSRRNIDDIHNAYAAYVFSQLQKSRQRK